MMMMMLMMMMMMVMMMMDDDDDDDDDWMDANACLTLKLHIWVQDRSKVVHGMVCGVVRGLFGYFWGARHGAWGGVR